MARLTTALSARLWSDGICTRWMTIRGFAYLTTVPPLPSFSERDPDVISANPSSDAWAHATAVPQSAYACFFLCVFRLPQQGCGAASRFYPRTRLFTERFFGAADISLCSGLLVFSPPSFFLP